MFTRNSIAIARATDPSIYIGDVEFETVPSWAMPGRTVTYSIRHGVDEIILNVAYVNSVIPCGPRSNIDLTYNIWTTLDYYCSNYAIVVLPSATSSDTMVYVRHILSEMGARQLGAVAAAFASPTTLALTLI